LRSASATGRGAQVDALAVGVDGFALTARGTQGVTVVEPDHLAVGELLHQLLEDLDGAPAAPQEVVRHGLQRAIELMVGLGGQQPLEQRQHRLATQLLVQDVDKREAGAAVAGREAQALLKQPLGLRVVFARRGDLREQAQRHHILRRVFQATLQQCCGGIEALVGERGRSLGVVCGFRGEFLETHPGRIARRGVVTRRMQQRELAPGWRKARGQPHGLSQCHQGLGVASGGVQRAAELQPHHGGAGL
jgi:hypothetical protein